MCGKLAKWALLVYWIAENNYSVLALTNFCPFDTASDKIQKRNWIKALAKLENGTLKDDYARRYIPETLELLELSPAERRLRSPDPQQNWESFSAEDVLADLKDGKRIEELEEEYSDISMVDDDDHADDLFTDEIDGPKTAASEDAAPEAADDVAEAKPKKKKKGRPPKKKVNDDVDTSPVVETKVVKVKPPPKSKVQKLEAAVEEMEEDMEEDPPSEEDKDDFEFEVDSEPEAVVEGEDDDLVAATKSTKGSKAVRKKAPGKAKKAKTPAEEGAKSKTDDGTKKEAKAGLKKPKAAAKQQKPTEELSDRQKQNRAARIFKKNEEEILPTLERLRLACDDSDMETILETLTTLEKQVDTMYWMFIEHHKVPFVIKQVKKVFKSKNEDITRLNKLREKMRLRYEEDKKVLPSIRVKARDSDLATSGSLPKRDSMGSLSERSTKKRESVGSVAQSEPPVQRDSIGSLPKSDGKEAKEEVKADRKEGPGGQQYRKEGEGKQAPGTPSRKTSSDDLADQDLGAVAKKSEKKAIPAELKLFKDRSPVKPRAKKFSLTSLMRAGSQEMLSTQAKPTGSQETPSTQAKPTGSRGEAANVKKELPVWMRNVSKHPLPTTGNRLFALEFYREMARQFPAGMVDRESMAITLEAETRTWAMSKAPEDAAHGVHEGGIEARGDSLVKDLYWGKVHALVAVVCGKHTPGALLHSLKEGDFHSAKDLIDLSDDQLAKYFTDDVAY